MALPEYPSLREKLSALAADIKIAHSVFALPWAVLATVLAAHRTAGGLQGGQLVLILICMVSARTVAMTANRLLDASIDADNPRTAQRAIPSGKLSQSFVIASLAVSAAIFIGGAMGFNLFYHNAWPLILSVPVLCFLSAYPLLKRFSELCHYYLGASLALAPLCAWLAIRGSMESPPIYMAAAVLLWTAGFDIIYACQDFDFDAQHGLHSVPARLGVRRALLVARFTHGACVGFLITLGIRTPELGAIYAIAVGLAIGLLVIEHAIVTPTDLAKVNLAFFTVNGIFGVVIGTLGVIDVIRH